MTKPQKRRDVIKAIVRAGCALEREGGKHSVYRCPCGQHQVVVPRHSEVTAGVVRSIEATPCLKGVLG